jgi:hypothetical protein
MISHGNEKNLSFMLQSSKGFGMDDTIPVMLKGWSERTFFFKKLAAFCI